MVISNLHPYLPLSGRNYADFLDETGQEYRITEYPHLIEDYWRVCSKLGMRLVDIREPKIDDRLIEHFPSLKDLLRVPLAMVIKVQKQELS